jgi:uncharacterized protein DUF1573
MKRHLRTVILAPCAALLLAPALFGQAPAAPAAPAGGPKAVAVEPISDVGTVPKGEKVAHDFMIKNDGNAVLQITEVQPACGCTVAEFDKTIAPGKTGKVHAVIDTTTFNGPIAKTVTVFTNDPANPQILLTVRAKVEPYISVKPGYARYSTVQGEATVGTIAQTLWAPDGTPMDVVSVDSPFPYLTTTFREAKEGERLPDAKGKQWRVEMTLSNSAPVGALAGYVIVHTNHPQQKVVEIPISGFVRPVIAITPPVADFGEIELKEPMHKAINIKNFATEKINVTGVEGKIKGIDTQLQPLEEGREYQVKLVLKPEMGKGPFLGKLTIHTDSPKAPAIEVELKGIVL